RHARIHGHAAEERPVEIVSYRLRVRVAVPKYSATEEPATSHPLDAAAKASRTVYFDSTAPVTAKVYERDRLPTSVALTGPAIVEQFDATTVIPPGWTAQADRRRNLVLTKG